MFAQYKDEKGANVEKLYTVGGQGNNILIRCINEKDNNEVNIIEPTMHGT